MENRNGPLARKQRPSRRGRSPDEVEADLEQDLIALESGGVVLRLITRLKELVRREDSKDAVKTRMIA